MALGDSYATVNQLEARLGRVNDGTFAGLLAAASRTVESFTRRQFNKATTATARRFRPLDWRRLPVDDFHTVAGLVVTVGGAVWDLTAVDPYPWNGNVDGQVGWPFYDLLAVGRSWSPTAVTTVAAQWGWDAIPEAVEQATLDLAVAAVPSSGESYPVKSEAIDGYSVAYQMPAAGVGADIPPELEPLVPYRRKRFGVA